MRLAVKIALGLAAIASTAHAAEPVQPTVLKAAYLFDSKTGKFADVVAVKGNVLNNIASTEKPVFVMKRGQVVVQP